MVLELVREAETMREAPIRKALGNTPDVSKAVRWLLHTNEIERVHGHHGGKQDSFVYRVATKYE